MYNLGSTLWASYQIRKIETVNPEGTLFDTEQVPSTASDMQRIQIEIRHGHLSHHSVLFWPSRKGHNHVPHDVH